MKTKQKSANLGVKGWGLVGFGAITLLVGAAFWNVGMSNIVLPTFAAQTGTDVATLLYASTIIGYIMMPLNFALGFIYTKLGNRVALSLSLAVVAVCFLFYGNVSSFAQYAIVRFIVTFAAQSYTQIGITGIYARYFPTKKGFAMGWATVGASATNIITLPIFTFLFNKFGLSVTFYIFAVYIVVLAVVNFIFIPNDPAKMGYEPDNGDSDPAVLEAMKRAGGVSVEVWTRAEALRTKSFWLMVIGHGILFMMTTGIMIQLVPHMATYGVPSTTAVMYIAVMGVIGMVSSAVSGWVDQKIGARRTTIIMGVGYALSCLCLGVLPTSSVALFLGLAFYCCMMGAISNLPASHVVSVFGSASYSRVYGLFFPIMAIVTPAGSAIMAFSLSNTGNYRMGYAVFMVLGIVGTVLVALAADGMEKMPGEKPVAYTLKGGEKKLQRIP